MVWRNEETYVTEKVYKEISAAKANICYRERYFTVKLTSF
jgi:hypothetical protein